MPDISTILDWLEFGKVSAERDDLLPHYFFDNGTLDEIINSPSSFLVLGRKGAGKTALFKYFTDNKNRFLQNDDVMLALSFEDYNWGVHSLLMNPLKADSMLYKQSWRFVMIVEAVKVYYSWFLQNKKALPKPLARAMKVLEKLFGSPTPSLGQVVGQKILALSSFKLPSFGLNISEDGIGELGAAAGEVTFDQVQKSDDLKSKLSENIEGLINYLDEVVGDCLEQCPRLYICFDRVDEAWDEDSFDSSRKVIGGLVTACDSVNAQYKGKIRPILFLREDIFDVLSINDSNKLRQDCGKLLHWNKISLEQMILRRVNYFAQKAGVSQVTSLDSFFDRQEMRQRAKPSGYILRRTMMRPRDLISLLDRVTSTMKEKAEDPFRDEPITFAKLECESVYNAEPGYSEWLQKELLDEWRAQKPIIATLFAALQNHSSTIISADDLEKQVNKLGNTTNKKDIIDYLKFLFDNSIIGIKLGNSTEWKFKCFAPTQGFVESESYKVHDGLVRSLNLTEPRSG
jgi:hypothetical protein